jgi:ferredoxin
MRIKLDTDRCTGHGRCYALGAPVFEADDDGYCMMPAEEVPAGLEDAARRGVLNCPERALSIVDEGV